MNKLTTKEKNEPLMITIGRIRTRILASGDERLLALFEHACKKIEENEIKAHDYDVVCESLKRFNEEVDPSYPPYEDAD